MRKTRRKNIFRSIKNSLNRFLSIMFIVALGSGFMAGLTAASPDMYATADSYLDKYSWYDLDVKSTQGLTAEDVEKIGKVQGVKNIQPVVVFDMRLDGQNNVSYTSRVYGMLDENNKSQLNGFVLTAGRMPQNSSECVVQSIAKYTGNAPEIGDVLRLSPEDTNYDTLEAYLTGKELTIVGTVEGPMCISIIGENTTAGGGSVMLHVYTAQTLYDTDFYTDVYVEAADAKALDCFGDEYKALINTLKERIENIADDRTAIRTEAIKADALAEVDKLKAIAEQLENLIETEEQLAYAAGTGAYVNAELAKKLALVNPFLAGDLASISEKTSERLAGIEAADGDSIEKLHESIADAEKQIDEIEEGIWLVRTREDSVGFDSYESNVGKVAALAKIFPVFFFVVALLVALTTMTRLIEENRGQIGTLKALGFSNGQILSEYMFYSLLASLLGCVIGFAAGFRIFPLAISKAYGMMFFLPATLTPIRMNIVAWVAPVTVGSIVLATLFACYDEFRSCPAKLMVPKAPAAGKRIWLEHIPFLWKHISFKYKVTFRNLFRYKKRFFMTIIGVSGCTALLLTGFGVKDSVNDIVDKQFSEIYNYELTLAVKDESAVKEDEKLAAFLNNKDLIVDYMTYTQENGRIEGSKKAENITIVVPAETERNSDFITLRTRKKHETVPYAKRGGVVLTEKVCEQLGISIGDTITLENADNKQAEFTVEGITENYVTAFAYISEESYEAAFNAKPEYTMIFCKFGRGADKDTIVEKALESDQVIYANSVHVLKATFADSIKSINGVVWVLIFAAGLLSIVVLYNLNNVNICERRKELATVRVLGFYKHETENYVFRESNILTLLGAVVGLGLGIWLHAVVVRTVEIEQVMFGRNIYPISYIYAIGISMIFAIIVNIIMRRNIREIDMVEAMKAND